MQELLKENEILREEIAKHQAKLIAIENASGRKQIPLPEAGVVTSSNVSDQQTGATIKDEQVKDTEPKKVKPQKSTKTSQPPAAKESMSDENALPEISRIDLRIGRIVEVSKHPDADALYLEKIDVGEEKPRTVISGLVKYVSIEEMQNRLVVLLCNLKPMKMRGITSEAMVMCASTPEKVEVLMPPSDSVPGDLVHCDGYSREPDAQLNPKKKILETVLPDLKTNDNLEACYKNAKLMVGSKGPILSQTLKNVNIK